MALIAEDGTGLTTANAYCTVAEADSYHVLRGTTEALWADLDTDVKTACVIRATDYMVQTYRGRWKGVLVKTEQALDWPRYSVYPDAGFQYALSSVIVPLEVKRACAELALRANSAVLTEDVVPALVLSETVGPVAVTYANTGQRTTRYLAIDRTLSALLNDGGSQFQSTAALG